MAEVGVDDSDDGRAGGFESGNDGRAEPELPGPMDDGDAILSREVVRDPSGAVRRVVVDDDELAIDSPVRIASKDRVDQIRQPLALVVGGNDKRKGGWVLRERRSKMKLASTIIQSLPR